MIPPWSKPPLTNSIRFGLDSNAKTADERNTVEIQSCLDKSYILLGMGLLRISFHMSIT